MATTQGTGSGWGRFACRDELEETVWALFWMGESDASIARETAVPKSLVVSVLSRPRKRRASVAEVAHAVPACVSYPVSASGLDVRNADGLLVAKALSPSAAAEIAFAMNFVDPRLTTKSQRAAASELFAMRDAASGRAVADKAPALQRRRRAKPDAAARKPGPMPEEVDAGVVVDTAPSGPAEPQAAPRKKRLRARRPVVVPVPKKDRKGKKPRAKHVFRPPSSSTRSPRVTR